MSATEGLAGELSDLGQALGILDSGGGIDGSWFGDPLGKLAGILKSPQRAALLRLFDALFPPATLPGIPAGEKWHPILGDQPLGNVYVTVKDTASEAVLGIAGDIGSPSSASGLTGHLRAQLPLVSANSGVHAVAGTASGPLKIQLRVGLPPLAIHLDAIAIEASIAPPDVSATVTLEGLALNGGSPKDVVLDPANLGSEASQLVVALLKQVLSQIAGSAAPGTEAKALVDNLTALLGLDGGAVPAFPITTLASDPAALVTWLRSLVSGPSIIAWLKNLAGLIGVAAPSVAGDGSAANPWTVEVLAFNGTSGLSVIASTNGEALRLGAQASVATAIGRVDAQAILASIPLNGTGSAVVLPSMSVAFRAPGTLGGPALVSVPQITVGSLRGGIQWDGATLRPLLELDDVTLQGPPSTHYNTIDLTDTDSVAAAASAAVRNAIVAALGGGVGAHLAALAGLIAPAGDPGSPHLTDLAKLVSDPAAAIAAFHRSVLLDATHNWSFLLTELKNLVGIAAPVSGAGTFLDPWRVALAPAGPLTLELAAWNAQTNPATTQQLRVGLRATATAAPITFFWAAELLAFDLPASGEGDVRLMGGQHVVFAASPIPQVSAISGIQIGADSFHAQMDWQPGSSISWLAEVDNLKLTVDSASVTVAALRFPIAGGFDVTNPAATAAALGVAIPDLEKLLRLLLTKAVLSWGGMNGFVLAGLLGVHAELSGLPSDWPVLADPGAAGSLLSDPFTALRHWLAQVATGQSADQSPFLPHALQWSQAFLSGSLPDSPAAAFNLPAILGSGTYDDPWALPLAAAPSPADLLVWLAPAGPPSGWANALASAASSATTFNSLVDIVRQLGAFVPAAKDVSVAADPNIATALGSLWQFYGASDGVVPVTSQIPTGGTWTAGTAISAAHPSQPHDASAISQINAQIDTWAGGAAGARAVLLLGPAFSDHSIWSSLLGAHPSANFDLRVPGVDPAVVSLTTVTQAVDYYTADLADDGTGNVPSLVAQIGRLVTRIGQLRPGQPVTLVAHSTAGVAARAYTAASPAQVRGLITLGTPHFGADLPFLSDPAVGSAVRFLQGLRGGMTAVSALRDALDHAVLAMDGYMPPASAGALPLAAPYPAASFNGSAVTDTGGRPALALGGTLAGDLFAFAKQAASTLATQAAGVARPAPTDITFGVRVHLPLPSPNFGDVQVDAAIRTGLFRIGLASGGALDKSFRATISLSRPGGWLAGGPAGSDVRVRCCEFGLDTPTGSNPQPFATIYQAASHGPTISRVVLSDGAAQVLLGEAMHAISVPAPGANAPAASLLAALQGLNVATPDPHGGIGLSADAFNAIAADAASFFATRLPAALSAPGGLLGVQGPAAGPWTLTVGPAQLSVSPGPSLSIQLASTGISLAPDSYSLSVGAFSLAYNVSAKTLSVQSPPWLSPFQLIPAPSASALKAALNDALPRLLFSAAAGALLEALLGRGFVVPPLDSFFSSTGSTAQHSQAIGNSTGDGFDGTKINTLLSTINRLAGLPASPGLTIPPGVQLTCTGAGTPADPVTFHLATTSPIGGVLGVALTASIDKLRHVTPGGSLSLTTPLSGTWPSVTITFGFTGSQVMLQLAPQGVTPIQILPTFSGLGALRGAAEALLPQALDALVTALSTPGPAPQWLTDGLAVATALGLYDGVGHFAAHSNDLRALVEGNFLTLFNPAHRASVISAAVTFFNGLGVFPGGVTASGSTLNWHFALTAPNSGTISLALGWDGSGPLAQISANQVKLASGAIIASLSAGFASGSLSCSADLGVSLSAALGIPLAPKFSALVSGSAFQVALYPLAFNGNNGPLTINLAPHAGVVADAGMAEQLIEKLLIPLVAQVAFEAATPKLHTNLWPGGPTLQDVLLSTHIIQNPGPALNPTLPSITSIASGLALALLPGTINLPGKLKLRAIHQSSRIGVALEGSLDFPAGNYEISALFGAPDSWATQSPGANDGLTLFLFNDTGDFNPGLLVAGLGLGLKGANDAPLVNLSAFRMGGLAAYLFFDAEFKSGLSVNSFGGGLELSALGLPLGIATSGNTGGNNPVASSLLRNDGGSSSTPGDTHPVNPGVDVDAWFWSAPKGDGSFHILFGGQSDTLWIGIHSGFGPIYIDQIGLGITNATVDLLIDGSVKVAGLTAQVDELTVNVPYKSIATPSGWSLDLKGLAIGFDSPGVTIAGALVKQDGPPVEYDGLVLIKIGDLGFIAVGAYSTPTDAGTHDTYTSFFVFAGVFVTIGIPPIIEISGIGLGVGYNREIIVPTDLNKIPSFLLVEVLDRPDQIADDPMGALMNIRSQLPARRGSFWLAVGLRGTSFEIVHVTAILYIALDRGVEIGILGVARMALPSDDSALVSIELAVKVRLSTAEQMFSIQAQLTDNSYLLSRDCQLTGGFAYFVWFAEHQFLLTMGGYHPAFHKRPEFPDVPRLGYHWSFLGVVAIKGESYFALTNTCVMAGTRFDATYGPSWLFVWFKAYCDFLISWDPFYYDIDIGVSVGATFRIHICFIGCCDIDITVSIGATLHVLGPPFHGEVTVDLAVASVTVPFGPNPNPQPSYIGWPDFVTKYLQASPGNEAVLTHVRDGLQPPEPAGGQPSPGTQDQPWKMKSEFSFRTETRMPAMEFTFLTSALNRDESLIPTKAFGHYGPLSSVYRFDLAPMGIDEAHHALKCEHDVMIDGWDAQHKTWVAVVPSDNPTLPADPKFIVDSAHFQVVPLIGQVSEAVYHLFAHDSVPAAAQTLPVLSGIQFTGVAVLRNPSKIIPILKLYDWCCPRPLPFATWSLSDLTGLQAIGAAADTLGLISAGASTGATLNAARQILSGGGFFSGARVAAGMPAPGLPPVAARALQHYRSAPPAIAPITTGLTMKPVGLPAPPTITKIGNIQPVPLTAPRLRAVLQARPLPTADAPPLLRTTVSTIAAAKNAPRRAAPKLDTVPGAKLHFVRAANAPRPTMLARSSRTLRSAETGWPLGQAHLAQMRQAEAAVASNGVVLPAGAVHVWDVPNTPGLTLAITGKSAARVTFLSRAGYVLDDRELPPASAPVAFPARCAMVAVMCLGNLPAPPLVPTPAPGPPPTGTAGGIAAKEPSFAPPVPLPIPSPVPPGPVPLPPIPLPLPPPPLPPFTAGFGAVSFATGNRNAVVGWQTGNLVPQVGSATLLGRGSVIILPQQALTSKRSHPTAQAMVRLSEALVDQPGVETWLPPGIGVVGIILDIADASASDDGDLGIAVDGATLAPAPVRVIGGNRKILLYDVASRDTSKAHIGVSVASRTGARMSGIVGLSGRAQEWGVRLNGRVPEHWVGEGPLTPDGQVQVRIVAPNPATGGIK